jgi:hypothetical protein
VTNWTVQPRYPLGGATLNANSSALYYDNGTTAIVIRVNGWANVSFDSPVNNSFINAGQTVNVTCGVNDNDTGLPLANFPINFYENGALVQTSSTDAGGHTTWNWFTNNEIPNQDNITCNLSNQYSLYYNASQYAGSSTEQLYVNRPLLISAITVTNSTIYRNDTFSPNTANLSVQVLDSQIGVAANATVYFYNSTGLYNNCTTDSNGQCYVL